MTSKHDHRSTFTAALASVVFHLLVTVLLALIALGHGGAGSARPIVLSAMDQPVETIQQFELEAEPVLESEVIEELVVEPDWQPTNELRVPEPMGLVETNESGDKPTSLPEVEPSPALASMDSLQSARLASSIQNRVSQAGGKRGEVQFALAWSDVNDLDMHVITPSGERISHLRKSSRCGGMLDVDMNVRGESEEPVENVRWLSDAPAGRYTVVVNLFRVHRPRNGNRVYRGSKFKLLSHLGEEASLESSIANRMQQVSVFRFQYVPDSVPSVERDRLLRELVELQREEESAARRLLNTAREVRRQSHRDQLLNNLIMKYPHTDAAIEAMQLLGGNIRKSGL